MVKFDSSTNKIMTEEPDSLIDDFEIIACPSSMASMDSMKSDITTKTQTDVSLTEVLDRFQHLLNENMELKETVKQNNMAMRQQCEMLARWQEQGRRLHQEHQRRHAQALKLASHLQQRSSGSQSLPVAVAEPQASGLNLNETHQTLESGSSGADSKDYYTKLLCDNERLHAQKSTLEEDVRLLKIDLDNMKANADILMNEKWELIAANTDMHSRLQVHQNNLSFSELKDNSMEELCHIERANAAALRRQFQEEKAKNEILDSHLKRLQDSRSASLEGECQQIYSELCNSQASIDSACVALKRYQDRCCAVTDFVSKSLEKISADVRGMENKELLSLACQLQNQIESFKLVLQQEQSNGEEDRRKLEESHSHLEKLLVYYNKIKDSCRHIDEGGQKKDSQSDAYHELASRGFKEQIDSLTAQLIHSEEVIKGKDSEIDQLKKKSDSLSKDVETISILKVQVDMYRADFQAERESRQNIAGEKEKLSEELQKIQTEKLKLQDELQVLQEQHYNAVAAPLSASRPPSTSEEKTLNTPQQKEEIQDKVPASKPNENSKSSEATKAPDDSSRKYTCPKCNDWFITLTAVQNHVEECLDRDMWPQ